MCLCVYTLFCRPALSCFMCISCPCIFILYVHSVYKYVHVCCFVYMYVQEQTHTCVSGHMDNCMGWVCTCVSATECSFTSTAFVTVVALCEKEGFWVASCVCPKFPEVGAHSCCTFHGSKVSRAYKVWSEVFPGGSQVLRSTCRHRGLHLFFSSSPLGRGSELLGC